MLKPDAPDGVDDDVNGVEGGEVVKGFVFSTTLRTVNLGFVRSKLSLGSLWLMVSVVISFDTTNEMSSSSLLMSLLADASSELGNPSSLALNDASR